MSERTVMLQQIRDAAAAAKVACASNWDELERLVTSQKDVERMPTGLRDYLISSLERDRAVTAFFEKAVAVFDAAARDSAELDVPRTPTPPPPSIEQIVTAAAGSPTAT